MSPEQIHILHVDDDPRFLDLTAEFLKRADDRFQIETASNATAALAELNTAPPDCIISDYEMPDKDGIEFLQTVRAQYPELPFILFTGKGSETVASEAISAGVTDYLQKDTGTEQYKLLANRITNAVSAWQTRQKVTKQEKLLRLTEFTGDTGGWQLDRDTGTVELTAGARRITRLSADDIALEQIIECFHPDDRERVRGLVETAIQTGEKARETCRLQPRGQQTQRLVAVIVRPVVSNGEVTALRGAINDITETRKRKQELAQTRDLVENMETMADIAAWEYNPDTGELTATPGLHRIYGCDPETELTDQMAIEYVHPEDRAAFEQQFRECIETGTPYEMDTRIVRDDGEHRWVTVRGEQVTTEDTTTVVRGYIQDITDAKTREQQLVEHEAILEVLSDAVYVVDEDGQFTYVNDEFVELVGYDRDIIIGSTPALIKSADAVDRAERQLGKILSDDGPDAATFEVTIQPRDGDPIICKDHMKALPYEGEEFNGSVGTLRDITAYKQRTQELRRKNEQLEEFTSVVSHDLQAPLNVAQGRIELAADNGDSPHLAEATDALDRSQELIEDLLTLARQGKTVGDRESVALAALATEVWQTTTTEDATLQIDGNRAIQADRSRLRQLLENLFKNAIEHGDTDITVTVGTTDDGFYVADTGPGIPEEVQEKVFEAGYSTTEDGTGFGLRIVKQVATAHGWTVQMTTASHGGAKFVFTGV